MNSMLAGADERLDVLEIKIDKLLNLQMATNTLLPSVMQRVGALDKKVLTGDIERARHLGPLKENSHFPHPIIFKMHHFQKGKWGNAKGKIQKYGVIQDVSTLLWKTQEACWSLREQLHNLGIKTRIQYSAVLQVPDGEEKNYFATVAEAKLELCKKYPTLFYKY